MVGPRSQGSTPSTRRGQVLTVPADLEVRAAVLIGSPFVAHGDDPAGWDCRGCARWCLRTFCGVDVPTYRDLYSAAILETVGGRAERARLIAQGLTDWRPVEPQAGVIAWLKWLGGSGHVGFMLSQSMVLHADSRAGTAILDLDRPDAGYRLLGAFVPGFVTEIRNL